MPEQGKLTGSATLELRWFYRDDYPDALSAWFRDDALVAVDERTDLYLDLRLEQVGVKLREGNLEVKFREQDLGIRTFACGIAGRCGRWRKWSFPLTGAAVEQLPDADPQWWTGVTKKRRQRLLDADGNSVPPTSRVAAGCFLELAKLDVRWQLWWTVGFEAFGAGEALESILSAAVSRSCEEAAVVGLDADSSRDYPELLARIDIDREAPTGPTRRSPASVRIP